MNIRNLLGALGPLAERAGIANKLGTAFSGSRDYYTIYGWERNITYEAAVARYERQDIAKRLIDAHAQETWRRPPEVIGSQRFNTQWKRLIEQKDLKFWSAFERADKLAGIGSFSIMFLGFDDGRQTDTPVSRASRLLYIQPYGFGVTKIKEFEEDASSPRYGRPTVYEIDISKQDVGTQTQGQTLRPSAQPIRVHWTRVVHVIESPLESNVYGTPRIMPVWNLLDDLLKVVGGSAENYWLSARGGLHLDVDKEMQLDEEDAKDLTEEVEEWHHQLRRVIRTRGVEVSPIQHDLPNPSGAFEVIVKLISGSTGIPVRVLLGAEAGHLASVSDRNNWADRIAERQVGFAGPQMLSPAIERLQEAGVLPTTANTIEFKWPTTYRLTPLEEAQTSAQRARSAANLTKIASAGVDLLTVEEVRVAMGFEPDIPQGTIFRAEAPDGDSDDDDDDDDDDRRSTQNRPDDE